MVKNSTRNRSINGLSPLSYLGVNPTTPPNFYSINRDPTTTDSQDFSLCDLWLNTATEAVWILVNLNNHVATWVKFTDNVGSVLSLTGNTGGAVFPTANNINVVGDAIGITIAGNPATSTLTASLVGGGIAAQSFPTGSGASTTSGGTATPTAAGVLNVLGNHNVLTGAAVANTVTVFGTNTITVGDLAVVTTGNNAITVTSGNITLSGTGAGAAANINLPITNTSGSQGTINLGASRFISNFNNTTAVGIGSGNLSATGSFGAAFGNSVLSSLTSGSSNSGFGNGALQSVTTGSDNSCFGFVAGQLIVSASGNTLIGSGCGNNITGSTNTSVGHLSLTSLTSGSNNVCIGNSAGGNYTGAETNNILIGTTVSGTVGESNITRIGIQGTQAKCFIAGIRGVTTDAADAIAVLVSSTGQLGTVSSSKRFKEDIKDMGDHSNLLMALRPVVFNFKNDSTKSKQVGLIAEEVEDILPRLVAHDEEGLPMSVKYHDLPVMLLNELQKQNKQIEQLHIRLAKLEKMVGIK